MRVAVAQTPGTRLDRWRETLALIDDLIRRAAGLGAQLLVLPECVWPAYCLGTRQDYADARAWGLPGPTEFLNRLRQTARERDIAICAGYVEEEADRLLNAACLFDMKGQLVATRYKCFLWAFDRDYFEAGERIEPIDASFGRVGVMICADARLPEIPATLAARGAELILHSTAWVNAGSPHSPWNPQPDFLIPARAAEFGVPIASASKWGVECDTAFIGSSLICDAEGNVLAQCGMAETTVIAADIQPTTPRRPEVTPAERAVLLSCEEPAKPRADVSPLEVLPLAPGTSNGWIAERIRETAAGPNAVLALRCPHGSSQSDPASPLVDKRFALLSGPTTSPVEIGGVVIGATAAAEACRFAGIRCLALQGVHVVVVFGSGAPDIQLKARACENRVFLVSVGPLGWRVMDPRGRLTVDDTWPVHLPQTTQAILDVALAASKCVAPRTDVVAGRSPTQYSF